VHRYNAPVRLRTDRGFFYFYTAYSPAQRSRTTVPGETVGGLVGALAPQPKILKSHFKKSRWDSTLPYFSNIHRGVSTPPKFSNIGFPYAPPTLFKYWSLPLEPPRAAFPPTRPCAACSPVQPRTASPRHTETLTATPKPLPHAPHIPKRLRIEIWKNGHTGLDLSTPYRILGV